MCSSTPMRMAAPGIGRLGIGQQHQYESGCRRMVVLRIMTIMTILTRVTIMIYMMILNMMFGCIVDSFCF